MFTIIRLVIWALPLMGLLKAREQSLERRDFTPEGTARDLRLITNAIEDHAATLPARDAATLRAIAGDIEAARSKIVAWGDTQTPGRGSWLRRLLGR